MPWEVVDAKFMRGRTPKFGLLDYVLRFYLIIFQMVLSLIDRTLAVPSDLSRSVVGRMKKMV